MKYILCVIYVVASAFALVLMKLGGVQSRLLLKANELGFVTSWQLLLGGFLYIVSFLAWTAILPNFKVTYISPILYGVTFIFVIILSWIILKDKVTLNEIVGCAVILIGICICAFFGKQGV